MHGAYGQEDGPTFLLLLGCLLDKEESTRHALYGAELRQQVPSCTADNTLRLQRNRFDFDSMPTEFTGRLRQPATLGHRYSSDSIPKEITGCLAWYHAQASESH